MNIYMLVDDITGVGQADHMGTRDWILVDDCTFGFKRPAVSGSDTSSTAVTVVAKAIALTKQTDLATTKLLDWMDSGKPRNVAIEFCIGPDTLYMVRLDLTKAQLRTYQVESHDNPEGMVEKYQLDFEGFTLDYWIQGKSNEDRDSGRMFVFPKGEES